MKRLSFFLTLIVTAALGSVFVASAQDPQEAPPAAPAAADEGDDEAPADDAAPDAAPDDEAPTDEAPADEAPSDDPPMDETPADETPADEPPADEPEPMEPMDGGDEPMDGGDEPMDGGDAAPTDAAPTDAAPAPEAAPAPAPVVVKKRKSSALSSLSVEEGQAQLERTSKQAGAEPRRATLSEGTQVGLTTRDTALLDAESSGTAKFGGCEVTLSENTTFKVLDVGAEVSLIEILGVELELERGTILEAAFGSLSLNVVAGRTTARNTSGVPQVLSITVGGVRITVTVPATAPGGAPASISTDANGNVSMGSTPLTITTQPVDASGNPTGPAVRTTLGPGQNLGSALGLGPSGGVAGNLAVQFLADNTQDAPPAGTTPGTKGASSGIGTR